MEELHYACENMGPRFSKITEPIDSVLKKKMAQPDRNLKVFFMDIELKAASFFESLNSKKFEDKLPLHNTETQCKNYQLLAVNLLYDKTFI